MFLHILVNVASILVWFRLYGQISQKFTKAVFLVIWTNVAKRVKKSVLANFRKFEKKQRVFLLLWSMRLKLRKTIGFR